MSQIKFEQTKFGTFLQSKGFYLALGICLLAIGAAAWAAVAGFNSPIEEGPLGQNDSGYISIEPFDPSSAGQVAGNVSGLPVPSSRFSAPASQAPASSRNDTSQNAAPPSSAQPQSKLAMPVTGDIIKAFSSTELQFSETYQDFRLHEAIDIETEEGAAVKAAASGSVTEVYTDALWGTTVVIDHGNGTTAYYSGLDKDVTVKKGDRIEAGKQIGGIGKIPCEGSDPVHLHFAVKRGGKWVNPLELMN